MWFRKQQQFHKMYQIAVVVLVVCLCVGLFSLLMSGGALPVDDAAQDTELLFTFLVHRHGDRTIISEADALYSDKPEALLEAAQEIGYGQLTLKGKQTAFKLGEYIQERYNELLAPKFNRSEVFVRSTDFTRTRMTILSALSAIYPPVEPRWSETVNWEPVPYTTLPVLYDYNGSLLNCPKYIARLNQQFTEYPTKMSKFSSVLNELTTILDKDFSSNPLLVADVASVLESQISLGVPLSPKLEVLYDAIKEAASVALEYIYSHEENLGLQAGPLLNDFLDQAALVISGNSTQKLRIHSAHDYNVYVFEVIIHATPRQGPPRYGSALSLELRRNVKTGEYVVLPVYLPTPGEKPIYLNIEGCDNLPCNYDQFLQITSPYVLDEDSWRTKCEWTKNFIMNESLIQ